MSGNGNVLSDELQKHYLTYGVTDIEGYIIAQHKSNEKEESESLTIRNEEIRNSAENTNGVSSSRSRFIRLNPRFEAEDTLKLLQLELPQSVQPIPVPWLSHDNSLGFYALPENFALSQSRVFTDGRVYGMDVSSGAAVAALLLDDHAVNGDDGIEGNENDDESIGGSSKKANPANKGTSNAVVRVLDLCCAPGLKTCAIADLLTTNPQNTYEKIQIIGVDISEKRMQLCKNIIKKYHVDPQTSGQNLERSRSVSDTRPLANIQLYNTDGTSFGTVQNIAQDSSALLFDSDVAREQQALAGSRKRMNKSARGRERKRLKAIAHDAFHRNQNLLYGDKSASNDGTSCEPLDSLQNSEHSSPKDGITVKLFDYVLVDAECSTDGAVRHLKHKYSQLKSQSINSNSGEEGISSTDFIPDDQIIPNVEAAANNQSLQYSQHLKQNSKLTDVTQLMELVELQKKLIASGYRLLKPGCVMVYSTCSLAREQNENVVSWLLEEHEGEAEIVPVQFFLSHDVDSKKCISSGYIQGTVRFFPSTSGDTFLFGGGFFLAKIRKVKKT